MKISRNIACLAVLAIGLTAVLAYRHNTFDTARVQAYCADMAKISINYDLEKVLPGSRAEFSKSCVAAAIRTAQFRAGR